MTDDSAKTPQQSKADEKAERLAAALRANLRRRKDQSRGRRDGDAGKPPASQPAKPE